MKIIEDRIDEQNTVMKNQRIIGFLDEMVSRPFFISLFILMLTFSLFQMYHYVPVFFYVAISSNHTILGNSFSHYFKLR